MFLDEVEAPPVEFRKRVSGTMADLWERRHEEDPPLLSDAELAWAVALYDGGIHHVDHWFGGFIDMLRRKGILDQAIVVVISDHGEEFQEHGAIFHERLYSTTTRIPMIIRFPQGRYRGVRHEVVESIDLMPTLLGAIGAPVPERVQGRSLMPMIGGTEVEARVAISESPYYGRRIAATGADHRLIFALKRPGREFFSYREDPLEQQNLSARKQRPEIKLMRQIYRWNRRIQEGQYPREKLESVTDSEREQLKALGYLR
jgi:arylsulfatase A-like enzyme